ncbi:MAG: hypothetical protein R3F62_20415 [Planctomycetota bacterium]
MFLGGAAILVARFYRKVNQGQALIVNKMRGEPKVTFTGATVLPIVHRAEVMEISLKTIELERRGKEGLICKDNIRADIRVSFFVRVNKTAEDVLKVAQAIGCERASKQSTLEELFMAKFSEALKTVGKRLDFVELYEKRDEFKDEIIKVIGQDLNGYVLEDAAIDYLEQTPLEHLDKQNILDAQGIKKITELTSQQNILTNDFKQQERKAIKKQDVEAEETILELERQQADAEAKQKREITTMQARELAETQRVQAEERSRAELARLKADEEIAIGDENKRRQVEVAEKNRERVVAVEAEKVERDRALEEIGRERAVELERIAKEKELEVQKKEIADVIRARIAVDKTVAHEEEAIKDLRATADAKRQKEVIVITAEAEAQEALVKDIKKAEASEQAAKFRAKEELTIAEAKLSVADKQAQAKIRLADGVRAEAAAEGLARVTVKEADAQATEKLGMAEARVVKEKLVAEAEGHEQKGLATVRVHEAEAMAIEKKGTAEAKVTREKLVAEATGAEQKGLATVKVEEARAQAIERTGFAEAAAIKEKLSAEATGLAEKAAAMRELDGVGREHEEFRLRLDKEKEVELAGITVRKDIAFAQAQIMREAFSKANIQIVGGDGQFFDKFVNAVSLGKSIDGAIDQSSALKTVLGDYLDGSKSLPADLKDVLQNPRLDASALQRLSVAAFLGKLSQGGASQDKVQALLDYAKELGIDTLSPER